MTDMVSVRNKTGEPRYFATLGEEGYPVHRLVGDDEVLELPEHLAERLAEQPKFEKEGSKAKPKTAGKAPSDTKEGE